jgi:hypothetical protein
LERAVRLRLKSGAYVPGTGAVPTVPGAEAHVDHAAPITLR